LFLLYAIFNSSILRPYKANTKALIFNLKGEDLFFLDKLNQKYENLGAKAVGATRELEVLPNKDYNSLIVKKIFY